MLYKFKVNLLKIPSVNLFWRKWKARRGCPVGDYGRLSKCIKEHAPGRSFVDVGCMWGVNGEHAFVAEKAGATTVKAVDVFGPTPEFEKMKQERQSKVEFILGDVSHPATMARIGVMDVVFCAGVLYHHPNPMELLVALRRICGQKLILRTSTIPEIKGLPNAAVYYPMLKEQDRKLWNLSSLGLKQQVGISDAFEPEQGYGNWFWGLTPSCLVSLLETAGFRIEYRETEPFAQTVVCTAADNAFVHRLLDETEAREVAANISDRGIAQPA